MKIKRIFAAVLAAMTLGLAITGCSNNGGSGSADYRRDFMCARTGSGRSDHYFGAGRDDGALYRDDGMAVL